MTRRVAVKQEQGVVMVLVILGLVLVTLLAAYLIDRVTGEQSRSSTARSREASFAAAEAGVDDYISKLVEDHSYYLHRVHPNEATRYVLPGGPTVAGSAGGTVWNYGLNWSYANGSTNGWGSCTWKTLPNNYQYCLEITPPGPGSQTVTIDASGRYQNDTNTANWRTVQAFVRPSSIADFQRIVDGDVAWGAGANTYGKLYANGNISHDGTAYASIYAQGTISGSVSLQNGAQRYDSTTNPSFNSVFPTPINFANLLVSIVDVQRAASIAPANYYDDATKAAWRLKFYANGTYDVQSCTLSGGNAPENVAPVCGAAANHPVPVNGAIYTGQTAIVLGTVNGRVTVASNDDIIIENNINYNDGGNGVYNSTANTDPSTGHFQHADDVLGLVAKNNVIVAAYAPATLTWIAAVLAQSGTWYGAGGSHGSSSVMNWIGSSTTKDGGSFSGQYNTRNYGYDQSLLYLPPPWFPQVSNSYTVQVFRELAPGGS